MALAKQACGNAIGELMQQIARARGRSELSCTRVRFNAKQIALPVVRWRSVAIVTCATRGKYQVLSLQPDFMIQVATDSDTKKKTTVIEKLMPTCISAVSKKLHRKPLIR